jgi:hypothetical protein
MAENEQKENLQSSEDGLIEVGELLAQTWLTFKAQYQVLLKISLLVFVPAVIGELGTRLLELWLPDLSQTELIINLVLINLVVTVFSLWTTATLAMFVSHQLPYSKELFTQSFKKVWFLFLLAISLILIVLGGLVLLIIPGLIFIVWFYFSSYFIILENQKPIDALKSSRELVRGHFWPVVRRLLWLVVVNIVVVILLFVIFSSLALFIGRTSEFAVPLSSLLSSWFLAPFTVIYIIRLFNNLKEVKN